MLLETVPGIRFRREWDEHSESAALKCFRNAVDRHHGYSLNVETMLEDWDFSHIGKLRSIDVIPFRQFSDEVFIAQGYYGTVSKATWDCPMKIGMAENQSRTVVLKRMKSLEQKDVEYLLQEVSLSPRVAKLSWITSIFRL